jgi:two-component system sensor histidine kinase CpxA
VEIPPELTVASDRDLFIRAIANLLRNAIRHGEPSAPISIRAEAEGKEVAITVADSGPGVPEADLARIFDAFYRVDTSRTRATGGTGLGLTIVKTCVEICCGSVSARNREPRGLEVVVRLPAAEEESAAERQESEAAGQGAKAAGG